MAVHQNKKSPSRRGMHRSHDHLSAPALAVEPTTGETHLRHHISPTGFYRGKKVVKTKARRVAALITVAVDCMGGDHGPHVTVPAALEFQARLPDVDVVLVGLRDAIEAELAARRAAAGRACACTTRARSWRWTSRRRRRCAARRTRRCASRSTW